MARWVHMAWMGPIGPGNRGGQDSYGNTEKSNGSRPIETSKNDKKENRRFSSFFIVFRRFVAVSTRYLKRSGSYDRNPCIQIRFSTICRHFFIFFHHFFGHHFAFFPENAPKLKKNKEIAPRSCQRPQDPPESP